MSCLPKTVFVSDRALKTNSNSKTTRVVNAAVFAARVLALEDTELAEKMVEYKVSMVKEVEEKAKRLLK